MQNNHVYHLSWKRPFRQKRNRFGKVRRRFRPARRKASLLVLWISGF